MRLLIIAAIAPILLMATVLLAYGVMMTLRGVRGDYESPHLYLTIGLISTGLGVLLSAVSATIAFAGKRRRNL